MNRPDDAPRSPYWAHRTSAGIRALASRDPVAVLPVAAVEQHGPHLPLSTDLDIGTGLVEGALAALGDEVPAVVLPAQAVGSSPEHAHLAGTLTLSAGELEAVLVALGRTVAAAGVRRLVLANSHGGNKAVVDTAALRLRKEARMLVVKAHWFRLPRPAAADLPGALDLPGGAGLPETEWTHGLHGGAVETAMMLHLHPDRVRTDEIRDFPSLGQRLEEELELVAPEGPAPFAWLATDLNPDGVTGNAGLATPELGRALVAHYADQLAKVIRDTWRFPLEFGP